MTQEEKLQLAENIRNNPNVLPLVPDGFVERYREQVDVKEIWIPTSEGDAHAYIIRRKGAQGVLPLYINFHGGGFVKGHFERDILFCSRMCCEADCVTIDVDYKVAPEYPYPIAVNEGYDLVKWAIAHAGEFDADPECVVVGGHSSGGCLTAALCLKANMTKEFTVRMQILDYPPMDLYTDPDKKKSAGGDAIISSERARAYNALYVEPERAAEPLASPIFATREMMEGLPEAVVITAGKDSLRFEGQEYAQKLREAGVKVTAQQFEDCRHAFVINCMDKFEDAQQLYVASLRQAFSK